MNEKENPKQAAEAEGNVLLGGFTIGMVQTNVYYLHREGSAETVLADPADHGNALVDAMEEKGLHIAAILVTHAHFDHIGGVQEIVDRTGAKVYISEEEKRLIQDTEANLSAAYGNPKTIRPDVFLRNGEEFTEAGMTFRCILTPGHTEGSCCYYLENTGKEPLLLAGDTLFEESVGRTDFPTGSMSQLVRSIREKLFTLPENTQVLPGHGGTTTIGHEMQYNTMV